MAATFGALTGLDLGGIRVHRGPGVSEQAQAYRARAFTRSGEIFLPDEAGPIEHGESRALVAHELAHVVQQRVLAPSLPDEDSPDGRELESEAVSAERWYRLGGNPPARLAHLPVAALLARNAGQAVTGNGVPATGISTGWSSDAGASGPAAASGVQRLGGQDRAAAATVPSQAVPSQAVPSQAVPSQTVTAWQEPGAPAPVVNGANGGGHAVSSGDGGTNEPVNPASAQTGGQPGATPAGQEEPHGKTDGKPDGQEEPHGKPEKDKKRPADLDDPASLDELATKVYPRLRRLLRGELITDRERAGLLGDFS